MEGAQAGVMVRNNSKEPLSVQDRPMRKIEGGPDD
jgi:hypothetical protein